MNLSIYHHAVKDIFISFPGVVQAGHPKEFYRPVIKTEVVFGNIVVFKWTRMLAYDNTLTFAF